VKGGLEFFWQGSGRSKKKGHRGRSVALLRKPEIIWGSSEETGPLRMTRKVVEAIETTRELYRSNEGLGNKQRLAHLLEAAIVCSGPGGSTSSLRDALVNTKREGRGGGGWKPLSPSGLKMFKGRAGSGRGEARISRA